MESFEVMPEEINSPVVNENIESLCLSQCGNNICEEIVCLGEGCPCPENPQTCPLDCL